jgi:hypothetical protein
MARISRHVPASRAVDTEYPYIELFQPHRVIDFVFGVFDSRTTPLVLLLSFYLLFMLQS